MTSAVRMGQINEVVVVHGQGKGSVLTLPKFPVQLSSKHMEEIGRSSHTNHLHVSRLMLLFKLRRGWESPAVLTA